MQYTIRDIPKEVDKALRKKAKAEGRSLNDVAIEALRSGAGISNQPVKRRDLSSFAGSWVEDEAFNQAIRDQQQIDPELWR